MQIYDSTKLFIMLIGIPGSGKSFYVNNAIPILYPNRTFVILSTDNIIEREAASMGLTYSQAFGKVKNANGELLRDLKAAVKAKKDIVWDQTNLTPKNRKGKLSQIPEEYLKTAVFFQTPDKDELKRRLDGRPGKFIPPNVIIAMSSQLEAPTLDEGFNSIVNNVSE